MNHQTPTKFPPTRRGEAGMATAEYAVGSVGAACLACIIFKLADDGTFFNLFQTILSRILRLPDLMPDVMPDKFQRLM